MLRTGRMLRRVFRPHWLLILAGLALFAAVLRAAPLVEAWALVRQLGPGQLGLLFAANLLVLATFSGRWWLILRALGQPVPYLALAGYRLAAFGVSYFTPGPQFGGEPLQVYLAVRRHRVPTAVAVAAVALDKTLELLVNFAFLAAGLSVVLLLQGRALPALLPSSAQPQAIAGAVLLLALPAAALAALWAGRHPFSALVYALAARIPARNSDLAVVARLLHESEAQVTAFCRRSPGALLLALLISAVSWAALIGEYWLALRLLGAQPTIWQIVAALTAMRLAFLVPLPGGLGALEASQTFALAALGFQPALGIALSLLIRARDIILGAAGLALVAVLAGRRTQLE